MSRIVVNLQSEPEKAASTGRQPSSNYGSFVPNTVAPKPKKKRRLFLKILLVLGGLLLLGAVIATVAGYWWWANLQKSPAYSLALLVDAARKDDKQTVEQFLDTNAIVDDFVPQVTEKATERYGRGFPPQVVAKATQQLQPLVQQVLPQIKETAKREIPLIIKEKAKNAPEVSPMVLAVGLGRLINVEQNGDLATIKANLQSRPVELKMQRAGDRWKVVGARDDALADKIADQVAQKVQAIIIQRQTGGKPVSNKDLIDDITRQIQQIIP
ncbi:MAG: hypothetical protein ABI954_15240 [Pyrinomonadaceae bacterium]